MLVGIANTRSQHDIPTTAQKEKKHCEALRQKIRFHGDLFNDE
jgi:hypothetical protein